MNGVWDLKKVRDTLGRLPGWGMMWIRLSGEISQQFGHFIFLVFLLVKVLRDEAGTT